MDCGAETLPRNEERSAASSYLPEAFADDPDRLARFQREAQVLASLNHPGLARHADARDVSTKNGSAFHRARWPGVTYWVLTGVVVVSQGMSGAMDLAGADRVLAGFPFNGDGPALLAPPLVLLAVLLGSCSLRPAGRRLA